MLNASNRQEEEEWSFISGFSNIGNTDDLNKSTIVQWGGKSLTRILEISSTDNTIKDFFYKRK